MTRAPLSFVRGGRYNYSDGSLNDRGSLGYYWETSVYAASLAYRLSFNSTGLLPQYNGNLGYGFSLRCLAR